MISFLSLRPRPQRSTLFPYTTLFRSDRRRADGGPRHAHFAAVGTKEWAADFVRGLRARIDADQNKEVTEQRSEEHTSELQSLRHLVCRLLLEKKKKKKKKHKKKQENENKRTQHEKQ